MRSRYGGRSKAGMSRDRSAREHRAPAPARPRGRHLGPRSQSRIPASPSNRGSLPPIRGSLPSIRETGPPFRSNGPPFREFNPPYRGRLPTIGETGPPYRPNGPPFGGRLPPIGGRRPPVRTRPSPTRSPQACPRGTAPLFLSASCPSASALRAEPSPRASIDFESERFASSTMSRATKSRCWPWYRNRKPFSGSRSLENRNEESRPVCGQRRPIPLLTRRGKGRSRHHSPWETCRSLDRVQDRRRLVRLSSRMAEADRGVDRDPPLVPVDVYAAGLTT